MSNKNYKSKTRQTVQNQRHQGFTLLELLFVMITAAVLVALAAPNFIALTKNNRITSITNELVAGINIARQVAVSRGAYSVICRSDNAATAAPTCAPSGGDWSDGYIVYIKDPDQIYGVTIADNAFDNSNGDTLIYQFDGSAPADMVVTTLGGADDFIKFSSTGLRADTASTAAVQICDDRAGDLGRTVSVTQTGRIASEVLTCPVP